MEWYTLFRQHILDRGIQYFEDGYVSDFMYSNNGITARVNGSDIYYYSAFPQAFSSILLLHFFRFKRSVTVKKTTCFRALRVR